MVRNAGGGNFSVGARTSWYPSLNAFRDHTRFHLIFKVPKQSALVSVGKLVRQWNEQDFGCSEWDSEAPVPVAGFNYGDFHKKAITDKELSFGIEGYAVAQLPDSLKGLESIGGMSPARLNEDVMVQAQNAMRVFDRWFGKSNSSASPSPSSHRRTSASRGPRWCICRSSPTSIRRSAGRCRAGSRRAATSSSTR